MNIIACAVAVVIFHGFPGAFANFTAINGSWEGEVLWKHDLADQVRSSPVLSKSRVYVGSDSSNVYSLNRLTGETDWVFSTGAKVSAPGVVANNIFYIGSYDNILYALNASTGAPLWNYSTVSSVKVAPALSSTDKVLMGSKDGIVTCLNSQTGAILWMYASLYNGEHPLAATKKRVFVGSNNFLYCIKTKNGKLSWEFDGGGSMATGAVLDGQGRVFVGSSSPSVFALHEKNGTVIWKFTCASQLKAELILDTDKVYLLTADRLLQALHISDGTIAWEYDFDTDKVIICVN